MEKYRLDLSDISIESKIVICGAAEVGRDYYEQLLSSGYKVVLWIDDDVEKQRKNSSIRSKSEITNVEYDYVIIAVRQGMIVGEMKKELEALGVPASKIVWRRPQRLKYEFVYNDSFLRMIYSWRVGEMVSRNEPIEFLETDMEILANGYENIQVYGAMEPRRWFINEEAKVAYLNNAKVACTSFKASLKNLPSFENYMCVHNVLVKESIEEFDNHDYFKYTFVRNPLQRLVSCYKSKYISDQKIFGNFGANLCYGRSRYLMGWLENVKSFDEFVEKICQIPVEWQEKHFRTQYDLIYRKDTCLVDYIGKFEELPDAYTDLQAKFNLQRLQHYNRTQSDEWERYYNYGSAMRVCELYKKDIVVFGYEKECEDFLKRLK